jgi:hypothetical protein
MNAPLRILILGGYGTFGGRLAKLLADDGRVFLIIAGRSEKNATEFCDTLGGNADRIAVRFDRDGDLDSQLRSIAPSILVDASGPFQSYGDDPYRVVRTAIANNINYLDLADGADFVRGIAKFDVDAKRANLFVLSGVSSFPVLTAAVVRHLAPSFSRLDAVCGGIAPSPYAGVGLNVIRAIASYTGKPVPLVRSGKQTTGLGLSETRYYTIAPPGALPLNRIRFSLVDVPDLQVLPDLWPSLKDVWMGAGPVPEILHRALNALARLVGAGIIRSASFLAPVMYRTVNLLRWGEHRGGMFVAVEGVDSNGNRLERSWHMIAEGDDGPLIPSMAAQGIILNCLEDRPPAAGARPATSDLGLDDYNRLFARRQIISGVRTAADGAESPTLYSQILGDAWSRLPLPIRAMHQVRTTLVAKGTASVERGSGLTARIVAAFFGFPASGNQVPVTVQFTATRGKEHWTRTFGTKSFSSVQSPGVGRDQHLVEERFGPIRVGLAAVVDDNRLRIVPRTWSFFGIPLPNVFLPQGDSYEHAADDRFNFHVEIGSPLTGLIVRYRGWLVPE